MLNGVMRLWFVQTPAALLFVAIDIRNTQELPVLKWGFLLLTAHTGVVGAFSMCSAVASRTPGCCSAAQRCPQRVSKVSLSRWSRDVHDGYYRRLDRGAPMADEVHDANAAQRRYWNTVAGPRWAAAPGARERRNRESIALLLAHLGDIAGRNVLEIGCGAGALTVPLAAAVGEAGRVFAVDIAEPMLGAARRRIEERGLRNIGLHLGDAQVFAFEPAAFDVATSRMGVMFFADATAAFRNIRSALKPGGRLAFACWGPLAENRHWLVAYDVASRHLGPPAARPAHEPSPLAFADPDFVRGMLAAAGFDEITLERAHPTIFGDSPDEEARQTLAMGPTARLIEEKNPPEAVRALIAREIEAAFVAAADGGEVRLPGTIFLVAARRPAH